MDTRITHWINAAAGHYPVLDAIMVAATQFGVPLILLLVAIQWWTRRDRLHTRHAAVAAGLSFVLGLIINQAIILFIHRPRPYTVGITHLLIAPSQDWSFPSDHATACFAVVTAFALQAMPRRTLGLAAIALLICWSRVYLGTHYVSDVIGGALTGVVAGLIVRFVYREGSRFDRLFVRIL